MSCDAIALVHQASSGLAKKFPELSMTTQPLRRAWIFVPSLRRISGSHS